MTQFFFSTYVFRHWRVFVSSSPALEAEQTRKTHHLYEQLVLVNLLTVRTNNIHTCLN